MSYTREQREAHAEQFIMLAAAGGFLETTISREVARTYGLPDSFIPTLKALKAKFRNELSFGGEK